MYGGYILNNIIYIEYWVVYKWSLSFFQSYYYFKSLYLPFIACHNY